MSANCLLIFINLALNIKNVQVSHSRNKNTFKLEINGKIKQIKTDPAILGESNDYNKKHHKFLKKKIPTSKLFYMYKLKLNVLMNLLKAAIGGPI